MHVWVLTNPLAVSINKSTKKKTPSKHLDFVPRRQKRFSNLAQEDTEQAIHYSPTGGGQLGEFCDGFGADCAVENAICSRHVCQCMENFFQAGPMCIHRAKSSFIEFENSSWKTFSVANRVVDPNRACGAGDFCGGGSTCSSGSCQCPDGTFVYVKLCLNSEQFVPCGFLSHFWS